MTARGQCPAVPTPGHGTVGHLRSTRDSRWDSCGTVDLKALARKVLQRDTPWDSQRDSTTKTVPTVRAALGQRDSWDAMDWRDWITERAAILEFDGGLSRAEADRRAFEYTLIEWLNRHPHQGNLGICAGCGDAMYDQASDWRTLADSASVHYGGLWGLRCMERYALGRRKEAADALRQMGIGAP